MAWPINVATKRRRSRRIGRSPRSQGRHPRWAFEHQARCQGGADRRRAAGDHQKASNPGGTQIEVFDQIRASVFADRSQYWKDLSMPFYGYNRPNAKVSEGVREAFWRQSMMAGMPGSYFCIKA